MTQKDSFGAASEKSDRDINLRWEIKAIYKGTLIVGGNVNSEESAQWFLEQGFDMDYVGSPYIYNLDFVERNTNGVSLAALEPKYFFWD